MTDIPVTEAATIVSDAPFYTQVPTLVAEGSDITGAQEGQAEAVVAAPETPATAPPPPAATPEVPVTETQESSIPAEVQALDNYLQTTFGVSLEGAIGYVREQQQRESISTLQSAWGVDTPTLNFRMQQVAKEFETLPQSQKALYDNAEGAQILWQRYLNRTGASPNAAPPVPQSSTSVQGLRGGSSHMFTRTQVRNMPDAERRQKDAQILYAEANGLVLEDM